MLHDPGRHETLNSSPWDPERVHAGVQAIVRDLEDSQGPDLLWPTHPLDDEEPRGLRHKSLYLGAAGVLWAMARLEGERAVTLRRRPGAAMSAVYAAYLESPDTGEVVPSYLVGEAGVLLAAWRLAAAPATADRLYACIEANLGSPTHEFLWGEPGTMLAALQMFAWTGEARWRALYLRNVEEVWRHWLPDERTGAHLWTQDMYGHVSQMLGAGHGFAGNVYTLLRGASLLSPGRREALLGRCAATLAASALVADERANWPPEVGALAPLLVQWCHGAPGIVTSFAPFPRAYSPGVEALLVQAGNLIWAAGPLRKGAGLCHGTAGNGHAFLTLYRRTGDTRWLGYARAFAMHALAQGERMREQYGQGRYSLWTGDAGLALYLWGCLAGADGLPGLDVM